MVVESLVVLALAYWGQSPDCGLPAVKVDPLPQTFVGLAEADTCRITLDPEVFDRPTGSVCMVVIHEVGHLLGFQHSSNPNSLMYPVLREPRWPCKW